MRYLQLAVLLSISIPISASAEETASDRLRSWTETSIMQPILSLSPVPVIADTRNGFKVSAPVYGSLHLGGGILSTQNASGITLSNNPYVERERRSRAVLGIRLDARF